MGIRVHGWPVSRPSVQSPTLTGDAGDNRSRLVVNRRRSVGGSPFSCLASSLGPWTRVLVCTAWEGSTSLQRTAPGSPTIALFSQTPGEEIDRRATHDNPNIPPRLEPARHRPPPSSNRPLVPQAVTHLDESHEDNEKTKDGVEVVLRWSFAGLAEALGFPSVNDVADGALEEVDDQKHESYVLYQGVRSQGSWRR